MVLKDQYVKYPSTNEEWDEISNQFLIRCQIPNTIVGIHIEIYHVRAVGSMYFNYKGQHSIILMDMVDAFHKYIHIDVGVNG